MGPIISKCIKNSIANEPLLEQPSQTHSETTAQQPPLQLAESTLSPNTQWRPSRTPFLINDLSQYLQWRKDHGRPVSPPTQRVLQRATNALEAVREQIPLRGNVRTDIQLTQGESSRKQALARNLVRPEMQRLLNQNKSGRFAKINPSMQTIALSVAAARVTESGNCNEFLCATLVEVGAQLEKNETVSGVLDACDDHCFAQLESPRDDGTHRVIALDAWANGPAVLQEDYARQNALKKYHLAFSNLADAHATKRLTSALVAAYNQDEASLAKTNNVLQHLQKENATFPEKGILDERSVSGVQGPVHRP